eukprot:951464-Prymnesium_polylepis.1
MEPQPLLSVVEAIGREVECAKDSLLAAAAVGLDRCAVQQKIPFWKTMALADAPSQQLLHKLYTTCLQGMAVVQLEPAVVLAETYLEQANGDVASAVDSLVTWQSTRTFGSGFASGIGGFATMAVAVPTSLFAAWTISMRLAFAIAHLHECDIFLPHVCNRVLGCLTGDLTGAPAGSGPADAATQAAEADALNDRGALVA